MLMLITFLNLSADFFFFNNRSSKGGLKYNQDMKARSKRHFWGLIQTLQEKNQTDSSDQQFTDR